MLFIHFLLSLSCQLTQLYMLILHKGRKRNWKQKKGSKHDENFAGNSIKQVLIDFFLLYTSLVSCDGHLLSPLVELFLPSLCSPARICHISFLISFRWWQYKTQRQEGMTSCVSQTMKRIWISMKDKLLLREREVSQLLIFLPEDVFLLWKGSDYNFSMSWTGILPFITSFFYIHPFLTRDFLSSEREYKRNFCQEKKLEKCLREETLEWKLNGAQDEKKLRSWERSWERR